MNVVSSDLSDHDIIFLSMHRDKEAPPLTDMSLFKSVNFAKLNSIFLNNPFSSTADDAIELYEDLLSYITEGLSKSTTMIYKKNQKQKLAPWMNDEFMKLVDLKSFLLKKSYKSSKSCG